MEQSESTILKENDSFVKALFGAIRHGMDSLEHAPGLITKILKNNRWQRRMVEGRGWQIVEFKTFEEFVTTKTPDGLGTSIQRIKDVCQHDTKVRDLIDEVLTKKPGGANNPEGIGGKSHKEAIINTDNISNDKPRNKKHGTSLDYTLRRLRKEAPELREKVINGEMTANAAAKEAGFRVTPIQLNPTNPIKAAQTMRKAIADGKIDMDYFDRFCSEVKANG